MNLNYAAALGISAMVSGMIAIISWRRRAAPGADGLAAAMLALTIWAFTYALRWLVSSPIEQYFWLDATYIGVVLAPTSLLVLAIQFTNRKIKLTRRNLALLSIEPVLTLLMLWTDRFHGLFFAGMRASGTILNGGIWFWINAIYSYFLMLIAAAILIRAFWLTPQLGRLRVGIILLGMLLPWISNVISLLKISPFSGLDITPFMFITSGLLFALGLFRYRLLEIVPYARHQLFESMSDGVIVLDGQYKIVDFNPAAQRICGISGHGIGQLSDVTFSPWSNLSLACRKNIESITEIQTVEFPPQYYEVKISPLFDQRHHMAGRLLIFRNITERKHIDNELRKSEERFRSVVQTATDAIITADAIGKIITWNKGASNIFQYSETEILGKSLSILMPENFRDQHQAGLHNLATGGEPHVIGRTITMVGVRKDGIEIPIDLTLYNWQSGKDIFFTGIIRDISERKKLEDSLQYQSTHDFLTGLYNRQYFETEIERLQKSRQFPISILMIDVNGLKAINDTIGHNAGDDLLRRAAQVLNTVFRKEDLVARIGGDEFVAILPNSNSATAAQVIQRLKNSVNDNNRDYPNEQALSLAVGVACGEENCSLNEVFKIADQAMYVDKRVKNWQPRLG